MRVGFEVAGSVDVVGFGDGEVDFVRSICFVVFRCGLFGFGFVSAGFEVWGGRGVFRGSDSGRVFLIPSLRTAMQDLVGFEVGSASFLGDFESGEVMCISTAGVLLLGRMFLVTMDLCLATEAFSECCGSFEHWLLRERDGEGEVADPITSEASSSSVSTIDSLLGFFLAELRFGSLRVVFADVGIASVASSSDGTCSLVERWISSVYEASSASTCVFPIDLKSLLLLLAASSAAF